VSHTFGSDVIISDTVWYQRREKTIHKGNKQEINWVRMNYYTDDIRRMNMKHPQAILTSLSEISELYKLDVFRSDDHVDYYVEAKPDIINKNSIAKIFDNVWTEIKQPFIFIYNYIFIIISVSLGTIILLIIIIIIWKTRCFGLRRKVTIKMRRFYDKNSYSPLKEDITELKSLIREKKFSPRASPEEIRLKRLL
jgi:hypothetical protein